ncbi:sensor histidine kinase [Hymenobacter oligotrophus]|uniref:Sensor histidine kinase n=1 Tax=Hymenobacter oligotrophus TaxID=2319843 RepID=A0A3B7R022_9BACT|nr:histidine kinase [Hymenobacter oligotrophus]AYA36843.1 sensor histidine kinase [Hymenobacter oligotrophus]
MEVDLIDPPAPTPTAWVPPAAAPAHLGAQPLTPEQPARLAWRGLLAMAGFYAVFAVFYAGTIAYTVQEVQPGAFADYLRRVLLFDYPLKALWTLPVWWLFFRTPLERASWPLKLLAHAAVWPLWVGAWFVSYYGLLNWLGEGTMSGNGRVWDVYIPALFYGVQFGVLHVHRFIQQLQHRNQLNQQLQAQAHASQMAALKAQINPHFLFNTLNSISASVPPELESTRELIVRLAHTFRFALDASRHEQLPLGDELLFLQSYLELEQARFGSRLQVSFTADDSLLAVPLPPMLVQPLVENAVRHGLAPAVQGGTIHLGARRVGSNQLQITVADTGVGLPPTCSPATLLSSAQGVGLRTTHQRLRALGSSGLRIEANQPHGLVVSFVLPI